MHAVVRETNYAPDKPIYESREFQEFQELHASRPGYRGSVVVDFGAGRFLTLTLWKNAEDMEAARQALSPVVERLLEPLMTAPSKLHGTGAVVDNDLSGASIKS